MADEPARRVVDIRVATAEEEEEFDILERRAQGSARFRDYGDTNSSYAQVGAQEDLDRGVFRDGSPIKPMRASQVFDPATAPCTGTHKPMRD